MASIPRIAVTGSTGGVGSRVAARLADRGVAQRLVVRDPRRAPDLPGAEVVQGSYGDAAAIRSALAGITTLFMVSGSEHPDRAGQHRATVDAAVAAGVERIVYLSFLAAAPYATFTFARDPWATEEHIRAAGVPFTFLRDSLYMDFVPGMVGADDVIRGPAADGRVGCVSRDDIADVAVAVLLGPGHHGTTYDVTGPAALSFAEMAEALSAATGRQIRYHAETVEEAYASRAGFGAPAWEVEGWVTTYAAIGTGELEVMSDTVARVTGHDPLSLSEFLQRWPDSA